MHVYIIIVAILTTILLDLIFTGNWNMIVTRRSCLLLYCCEGLFVSFYPLSSCNPDDDGLAFGRKLVVV